MITVVQSAAFTRKCRGKYAETEIDDLVESIGLNPKQGHKLQLAGCVYRLAWSRGTKSKHEYDVYYIYQSARCPVLIVTIFKRGEKDVLSKVIACLAEEAMSGHST